MCHHGTFQDRVGAVIAAQRCQARGPLRVTVGDHDQHLQRGDLQRQTGIRAVVGGNLPREQCGQLIVAGVKYVPGGEARQELDPAGVIVDLGQRLAQAVTRPGQTRVEGRHRERRQQLTPIVAGRSFLQCALQVGRCGIRRAASTGVDRRVFQRRRGDTVALRRALEQVPGNDVALRPVREQRSGGLAMQPFTLGARQVLKDRDSNQRVCEPLGIGAEQTGRPEGVPRGREIIEWYSSDFRHHVGLLTFAEHREGRADGAVAGREGGQAAGDHVSGQPADRRF